MNDRAILLRYHEIALKGENRGWFEERLAINARKLITRSLGKEAPVEVTRQHSRIIVKAEWNEATREALTRVFGITSFSPMIAIPTDKETLLKAALDEFRSHVARHGQPRNFRVLTRRSDKALPEKSTELDHFFGGEIKKAFPGLEVSLKEPELTVGIEVRFDKSYIWLEKIKAEGGLPVGTNARALCLISGGLDSPIAAIKVLRRGSPISFIHFYGEPFVGEEVLEKVEDLVRIVNRWQPDPSPLIIVPFGKIQEKIALATTPKMRTILYRRMMVRIACEAAKKQGILALVTGESLGQVASQTVENMATINAVASLPILRPLLGYDKDEIIQEAHRLGSFETSIRPAVDCCTLFADRHPTLRSTPELVEVEEAKFPVAEYVQEAVAGIRYKRAR